MVFALRLAELRRKANLSQEQVAEQLHITRQAVSKWEAGQSIPDVDTVLKLCEILGVTPNQLFLGEEKEETAGQARKFDIVFVMSAVFLMVIFVCGAVIMLYNFFNGVVTERLFHLIGIQFMVGSILGFTVMAWMKKRRERNQK